MNNNTIINIVVGAVGLVGIGYAIGTHTKMAKISERLDQSIDKLAEDVEIDIPDEVIKKAIDKAVANEARRAAEKAANDAVAEVRRDIHRTVTDAVEKEYSVVKDSVLSEITASAAKIDTAKVRKDVEEAAKKAALEKFDANLGDILQKFSDDWDNTAKIYGAIKNMVTPTMSGSKEYVFRVG